MLPFKFNNWGQNPVKSKGDRHDNIPTTNPIKSTLYSAGQGCRV
ncbi:hypothetical protein [Lyngbya sp. CCY1209]|nr:hypothetical protein [Lyngbya sp. CCY1209]